MFVWEIKLIFGLIGDPWTFSQEFKKIKKLEFHPSQPSPFSIINVNLRRTQKKLCKRSWSILITERITRLNYVTRGWINYFSISTMKLKMERIDEHLRTMLRKVIWKQWKTPMKRAWSLHKLGIESELAKCTSFCSDHYEWGVIHTCAISKEVLNRRGLVSCLDYYLIRRSLKTN